jgi:sugar lactone lactonase YvrE
MEKRFLNGVLLAGFVMTMAQIKTGYAEQPLWSTSGFDQPESVFFDKKTNQIFVTNINGAPGEENGQGYISLLSAEGNVLTKKWITGLDAPKGMAVVGNMLVVSDIHKVHTIDIDHGVILRTYEVKGAKFLNDVAASDVGIVYISDMMDNAIYALDGNGVSLWLKSDRLSFPNGLYVDDKTLYVGSWGMGLHDDFTTDQAGSLLKVDITSKVIHLVQGGETLGNIDGITRINDQIVLSDWVSGKMYAVSDNGLGKEIGAYKSGLADISSFGQTIYMPYMLDNKIEAIKY